MTISVSSDLLRRLDARRKKGKQSRSAAIEAAIAADDRAERKRKLDEEIRAYYAEPESAEDVAMSKALTRMAIQALAQSEAGDDDFSDSPGISAAAKPSKRKRK
ncbi:MAG TPA: ribbon-helix-helix protein, CopG family [Myxococcales bacterium]